MTHPRIARLEIDAALAEEQAKYKRVVANIAALEQQRTLASAQEALRSTVNGFTYLVAVLIVAFVAWAYVTTPPGAGAADTAESHDTSGERRKTSRTRTAERRSGSASWIDVAQQTSSPQAQGAAVLGP